MPQSFFCVLFDIYPKDSGSKLGGEELGEDLIRGGGGRALEWDRSSKLG